MDNRRRQSGESQARHPAAGCFGIRSLFTSDESFGPPLLYRIKFGLAHVYCSEKYAFTEPVSLIRLLIKRQLPVS